MGRDLLNRPNVPVQLPDEDKEASQAGQKKGATKARTGRTLGDVGEVVPSQLLQQARSSKTHKHAYFNRDSSGVSNTNFGQSGLKALRGTEEATDLRKIVLPASDDVENPEGKIVQKALQRMGLDSGFKRDFAEVLGNLGGWAQEEGRTAEQIKERMAQLESMVQARRVAVERMRELNEKAGREFPEGSLGHAERGSKEDVLAQTDDIAAAGSKLIGDTAQTANAMHQHLAKMFGVKVEDLTKKAEGKTKA